MKLVEMLALEYRRSWIYGNVHDPVDDRAIDDAYIAGFQRCREIIKDLKDWRGVAELGEQEVTKECPNGS